MKAIFLIIRKLFTVLMQAWTKRFGAARPRGMDEPVQARRQRRAARHQATIYSFDAYIKEKQRAKQKAHSLQPRRAKAVPESDLQRPPRDSREEWQIRCSQRKSRFLSSA